MVESNDAYVFAWVPLSGRSPNKRFNSGVHKLSPIESMTVYYPSRAYVGCPNLMSIFIELIKDLIKRADALLLFFICKVDSGVRARAICDIEL